VKLLLLLVACHLCAADFTLLLLPDTQKYTESFPATFLAQTEWVRDSVQRENIAFVIHLGDITENNTASEWELGSRAMATLEGKVPYSVLPGNHDGFSLGQTPQLYNQTFPPSRFQKYPWYGGHSGETNENNYCFFRADNTDFLVLSLRFGPTDADLAWASQIVRQHPKKRVIVATHAYMFNDNTRLGPGDDYSPHKKSLAWNDGEEIWEKFIRHHANIFLVVSGHVYGAGRQTSKGDHGNTVHEILADYQKYPNGGDGWLRLLYFDTKQAQIRVRTYSPTRKEFLLHPDHDFTLSYPKP
jgi:3',5'-cyclic AMP phosphodiesterase CpdA